MRRAYEALNRGDIGAFAAQFSQDAVWHGAGAEVHGREAIESMVQSLVDAAEGTLHVEVHDVLASERHVAVLQLTRAEREGRTLADRVVYVFHIRDGRIAEAWFSGDPRIQDEFWA